MEKTTGEFVAFLQSGDTWEPGFADLAARTLREQAGADTALGRVRAGAEILPDRVIPLSAIHRDERALLAGLVIRRRALQELGGFQSGLGPAAAWEFMTRAMALTSVLQIAGLAGKSGRDPILDRSGPLGRQALKDFDLALLVKLVHQPLRLADRFFSSSRPEEVEDRARSLARLCEKDPPPLFDPWEFLAEYNTPHHYLYSLSERLTKLGLPKPARRVLKEALRLKPSEPKLWGKLILSYLK
jgi:hypothetical protein